MARVDPLYGHSTPRRSALPRRVATLSVHTSPLDQPGSGDAGGMNVYIVEVARRIAEAGVQVEIFTRATRSGLPSCVELAPNVLVRHVVAGPFGEVAKEELPAQLCAFTAGVLRVEAASSPGRYDLIHSHYWLSGQVGWLAKDRWGVPLVHTAHTLAKVKNRELAQGDTPEPRVRVVGEEQVVTEADRLVANTPEEARELIDLYQAQPDRVAIVPPGVDLERFSPANRIRRAAARRRLELPVTARVVAFAGRIQPLKGPDVLLRAVAELRAIAPECATDLVVVVCGGHSGGGDDHQARLVGLSQSLGLTDMVRFLPARPPDDLVDVYHAADLVAVPSHNESFGLVALEAQACGTPVVAAAVGGLVTAVRDGVSGLHVKGHDPYDWAKALEQLLAEPGRISALSGGAVDHARKFSWNRTACELLGVYRETLRAAGATSSYAGCCRRW